MARLLSGSGTISGGATQAELDAFTGSTNIATVGTIGTGTWGATDVAVAHGGTGASTHTANNVLIGAGTGAITSIAPSSDGQVLTSTGTVWQSEALPAAATGWTLLEDTGTFSGVTSKTIGTGSTFTSSYDDYMIVGSKILLENSEQLIATMTLGGSDRTSSYSTIAKGASGGSASGSTFSSASYSYFSLSWNALQAATDSSCHFRLYFAHPTDTTPNAFAYGEMKTDEGTSSSTYSWFTARNHGFGPPLTAFTFKPQTSGNISGTLRLYGLAP